MPEPTYSLSWFEAFADSIPEERTRSEVEAIASFIPVSEYPRVLDIGCGVGRVAHLLEQRGYEVTGIDVNAGALHTARNRTRNVRLVALDQRDVAKPHWTFDAALVLWNSLGFGTRSDDVQLLDDLAGILRPGGRLLLDLYHPQWLEARQQHEPLRQGGVMMMRWISEGRLFNTIQYADDHTDHIEFNVYTPSEIRRMLSNAGYDVLTECVWWNPAQPPSADHARYQVVAARPGDRRAASP